MRVWQAELARGGAHVPMYPAGMMVPVLALAQAQTGERRGHGQHAQPLGQLAPVQPGLVQVEPSPCMGLAQDRQDDHQFQRDQHQLGPGHQQAAEREQHGRARHHVIADEGGAIA